MKFMDLADEYSNENSEFAILPVEYEHGLTYGKGASKGPAEIIKASKHLEYYDEQFDCEPFIKGIQTLNPVKPNGPDELINIELPNKFTITLGGDHAVTIGALKSLRKKHDDFSVIIFDAHSDFFHSWNNSQYNHRCVAQRSAEENKTLTIGVRSMDIDEKELIENNNNINIIKAYDYNKEKLKQELQSLGKKVYISIDVDVFDPSFIRNTGTPEPGGFMWNEMIEMLKMIFENKEVIGADIVEFAPNINFEAEAFSLAKLCYKIMAMK